MKNIMTAKEWLEKEFEINKYNKEHHAFLTLFEQTIPLMERYANYKTKELEAKILMFRQMLKHFSEEENSDAEICEYLLYQFDKDFNITTERNG